MNSILFRKIGKKFALTLVWVVPILLTGCWDRREINDVAIVLSTGIDYINENEIELSAEIVIPEAFSAFRKEGGSPDVRATFVETATGETIAAARTKMQEKIARTLFWGHADATVFGEKMAERGIREHLDFFARTPDARLRNKVFVCEGEAKDFITSVPHLEDSASDTLNELSQFQISIDVTMSQLMQMMSSETGGSVLPYVKTETSKGKGKMKGKTQLTLSGVAVFEDDKMIEKLDDSLTRGLLWVRDEINFATITADVDDENGKITSLMIRSHTKLIPHIENGKWSITIRCKTEDDLVQNASTLDIRKAETINMIEENLEEKLETRIKQTVERVQKDMQVDVLKFNRAFQQKYPKAWKQAKADWKDIYPDIEVSYDISVKVLRPGLSSEPSAVPDNEVKGK